MNTHEKAILTYEALQKRKQKKKDQERQHKQDLANIGWNGTQKFINRENKRYYSKILFKDTHSVIGVMK